jgi:hypothetical protein
MRLSVWVPTEILAVMTDHVDARVRFEQRVDSLRGRRVLTVDYWDLRSAEPDPEWDYGDWHHAVMGVQLTTDTGPVSVIWTATFEPYGVEIFPESIDHHLHTDGTYRVGPGADSLWNAFVGQPIRHAKLSWDTFTIGPAMNQHGDVIGPAYDVDVPTALRLDFDAGPVWFVAAQPQPRKPHHHFFIPGDEIVVVFAASKMREAGYAAFAE